MRAVGKHIVIEEIEEDHRLASGLLLGGEAEKTLRYKRARVISPGTEVVAIGAGDFIQYDKAAGYSILINGEKRTVIQERDVAIIE